VDDKIINRANQGGESCSDLTERFIDEMHRDEQALYVVPPDSEPRATESIQAIVDMIQTLIDKQYAYVGDNHDVYYAVDQFEGYGKLSGRQLDELQAGERVDVDGHKRNPLDFVLWKSAKPGEPSWESPWGPGRPGWHIECSAMSTQCLGNHFDIHGGGMDLQFPHHENEIAQSEAATGEHFVNVWMHNGFVRIDDEKMSKSLGNFFTVRAVLEKYRGEEVRLFILSSHYRSPLNYSDQQLSEARASLETLYTALRGVKQLKQGGKTDYSKRFEAAMNDDFNTPEALSVLFECAREVNRLKASDPLRAAVFANELKRLAGILGLLNQEAEDYFKRSDAADSIGAKAVEALIKERLMARANKDWALADQIRDQLSEKGIVLEDAADQTTWRRK
jgi:cysteinyl-tRNA synthetase